MDKKITKHDIIANHFSKKQIIHINRHDIDEMFARKEPIVVSAETDAIEPLRFPDTLDKILDKLKKERIHLDDYRRITLLISFPETNPLDIEEIEAFTFWRNNFNEKVQFTWSLVEDNEPKIKILFMGTTI